ncbi:hypothetical protein NQ314_006693 [Rhamnusium bicolor]|uniref:Calponin-homology (CH) domain-containing protein n=1 Tax=Rhamnusium bicolor TaxID=1586634 RepID=A0AAV8YZ25_9CUCU|nr:hypothetical protein NQ314_006693 [Rhamnusium bicolor]
MKEIIKQWIEDRLGIVINISPELFAQKVKDGYLLSAILKNYGVITEEQLEMIEKSDLPETCFHNFKNHINGWLNKIGISVADEDLLEIVNSKGTSAFNLFYQSYLELNTKDNLYYISQQRLNEKLHPKSARFTVETVKKSLLDDLPPSKCRYGAPVEEAYDIVHWQQDRLEMLVNKCKEAREEYMRYITSRQNPAGSLVSYTAPQVKADEEKADIENLAAPSINLTYGELRKYAENIIFKKELERDILRAFWDRLNQEEEDNFTKNITDILLKQSLYEKQMLQKLGEVKLQKEIIVQNKQLVETAISKQKEADFVEKLVLREKELNEHEFTYYLEKERVLQLHRKLYEEKLRLKAQRHYNMCLEAIQDIAKVAFKESEYKEDFGEQPTRRIRDMWKKMFIAAVPFEDQVKPLENIAKRPDERSEYEEEIIHLEIDRQDSIDKQDFESYMSFEWPWELDGIEVDENGLYEMDCGLNVLGSVVHNLLETKYPSPPLPVKPDFPNIDITACINGFNEMNYLPLLQKIVSQREILIVEIQDAVNFCMNAYKTEIEVEVEDEHIEPAEKRCKTKRKEKISRNQRKSRKPKKERNQSRKKVKENLFRNLLNNCQQRWTELCRHQNTYEQAALLEQALTGLPVPELPDDQKTNVSISEIADLDQKSEEKSEKSENQELRQSKILPDPVKFAKPLFYDTALTAYIKVIKKVDDEELVEDDPLPPVFKELENNADPLDRFYSDLGCNYSFYYKKYDFDTIKYLAKLVIGDYSIPVKTSIQLFGDSIKYVNASWGTGDKSQKDKGKKGGKGDKGTSVVIVHEDKFTQMPEIEEEIEEIMEPVVPPKAGEPGWEYTNFAFPEELQIALATLWENAEEVYIEDFSQIFFLNRIDVNAIMPFVNFVKIHMDTYITRPDDKQVYLREFQRAYNEFDDDFRNDEEFKGSFIVELMK